MTHHVFNDRQKKLILDRSLSDSTIATRLGISPREVKRQRSKLLSELPSAQDMAARVSA